MPLGAACVDPHTKHFSSEITKVSLFLDMAETLTKPSLAKEITED